MLPNELEITSGFLLHEKKVNFLSYLSNHFIEFPLHNSSSLFSFGGTGLELRASPLQSKRSAV
jgi:hypothetical protein